MSKDQIRSEWSELFESTESAGLGEPTEPASPGAFLRSLIAAARPPLLQKAVARHLGVSPGTVSDWLRDRHVPRWDHLDLLERLLIDHGVDLERGLLARRFHGQSRAEPFGMGATSVVASDAPVPLTPLVGRDDEVEQLMSFWEQHRLVCVTGPAGVGKTRLAAAVADRINEKTPGEVMWLRIDNAGGVDELYQLIALALHARTSAGSSMLGSIARAIGAQPRTIVLDDLDKVDDGGHSGLVRVLERCAGLRIIATSRRGIQATGAARFRVEPLAIPDDGVDEAEAREYPAVRLFTALAKRAGTGQAVTGGSIARVNEICRSLGGLPFCLELAAAQLDTITLHELHQQLIGDRHFGLPLPSVTADGDAELHAALESSWNMLSSLAQQALACSSVFSGPFDAERATRVIALSPSAVRSALHELVRSSMVQVDHSTLHSSYHILGPLRHFAAQRLDELGDGEEVRTRHAGHVAQILDAQFPLPYSDAVDRIGWSDLTNALQWSFDNDPPLCVRIAGNLWPQWLRAGAFATGGAWLRHVVDTTAGEMAGVARLIVGAGVLAQREGDTERAASLLADGLRLACDETDAVAQHVAKVNLGWLALIDGRVDRAVELADDVLDRTTGRGQHWGDAAALSLRGSVKRLRDDPGADDDLERSLAVSTTIGDITGAITANLQLARLALGRGDVRHARHCATAGLADAERINDQSLTGAALVVVGLAAGADGDGDEAVSLLERATDLMERSEEPMARCRTRLELARARARAGGTDATGRVIADILTATEIAVDGNVRVLLPLCFETMGEVVTDPADIGWFQDAADTMRHHFGLADADAPDAGSPAAGSTAVAGGAPPSPGLAGFGDFLQRALDQPSAGATS